jgi:sugar phosphate isomerase/epimerase
MDDSSPQRLRIAMRLACADFSFPLLPHEDSLRLIAMLGFEGVDIGVFGGRSHVRPDEVLKDVERGARELSSRVRGAGLEFADIFLIGGPDFQVLAPNHPDAGERRKAREQFQRTLELSARCESRHMSGLPGIHWEKETRDESLKRSAEELAWRVEEARRRQIIFSVEPHIGSIIPTPPEAMELVKMTPGLSLTLDYGHFTYRGIPDAEIEPLIAHASHFHARGGCTSRLQAPLKTNTIDFARVVREMRRTNYAGWIGVEYVWIDWEHCNEVDNVSETILLRDLLLKEGV